MALKLHNTLTGHTDDFVPLSENKVTLYTCGPTVYDLPHVGNWTSFVYWDILVRTLLAEGYTVERVMNITDVGHLVSDADDGEDKLEKGARREGKTAWEIAEFYAEDFMNGMEQLGMVMPEHLVKATDFIPQQLDLVRVLKEKGYTYQTTDGIYFDTSKFPTYADFARLDLEAQKAGARVEVNNENANPGTLRYGNLHQRVKNEICSGKHPMTCWSCRHMCQHPAMSRILSRQWDRAGGARIRASRRNCSEAIFRRC